MIFSPSLLFLYFYLKIFFKLSWIWFFDQSYVFRIQQLKQLLEDSTSDDDGSSSSSSEDKEKHKKKKKKEKHKKKKKEKKKKKKRKHKSSKSNESSDSEWRSLACSTFSSQKPNTVAKDERTRGGRRSRRGTGETPRGRGCGGPGAVLPCLPGRMWVVCCQVLALATPDFRLESFSPCAPPCWSLWVPTP